MSTFRYEIPENDLRNMYCANYSKAKINGEPQPTIPVAYYGRKSI